MKLIERASYLNELTALIHTPDIKIITGVRRCGKSKLLEAFAEKLLQNPGANVIHINFNLVEFSEISNYHSLEKYVEQQYIKDLDNYLLVDEIQMCESFEKAIISLHAKEKYDIYITGSNAFLQSSDLATLFVGRSYEIHVFPFSFKEYLEYYPSTNRYDSFTKYMTDGGMSGSYLYLNQEQKFRYLSKEILNTLIVRDIIQKHRIRNEQLLQRLIDFFIDNTGNLISSASIVKTLSSCNIKPDHKTIDKYISYICRSFAFYRMRRYDIKGKKYLQSSEKYYLCDHSFKYARVGTRSMNLGHVLENIIAIELMRRYWEVYAGVLYKKEIDFVALRQGEKRYIQVAYDISDPKTLERELDPLLQIRDAYPKMLIARTYQSAYQIEGVRIVDPADWLLDAGMHAQI